jgi:dipeptidyl-peptidase-4
MRGARPSLRWLGRTALVLLLISGRSATDTAAQDVPGEGRVTRANYDLADRFTANRLLAMVEDVTVRPVWLGGGERFWYALRTGTAFRFFLVDVEEKTRSQIAVDLTIAGPNLVEFELAGRLYRMDTVSREVERIDPERPLYRPWDSVSPDGSLSAFARRHNLFIRTTGGSGGERQVTNDGEAFYSFAEPGDPFYTNEASDTGGAPRTAEVLWAPDSRRLVAVRRDVRTYRDNFVLDSLGDPRPEAVRFKQRFPGDPPPRTEIWVYDVAADSLFEVAADRWPGTIYEHIVWSRESERFYVVRKRPDQLIGELLEVDAYTGNVRVLIVEDIHALVLTRPVVLLPKGDGFLWWSRRDGYGHFYLCDFSGKILKQVTAGDYNVSGAVGVDARNEMLFFTANGRERRRNPYYDHLYSVGFRGGEPRLLTYEDAQHEVYLAPSHECFVDNYSRVDEPPRAVLKDARGDLLMELEAADVSALVNAGWREPEVIHVKGADGRTDIWGVMYKPCDFDPERKYAVISFVYPGPQDEGVPLTYTDALNNNAHLAQYGFIVLQAGNRGGSYKRSLEYSEYYRGNLRDYPVADNRAVIEEMASRHEWIDLDRVGIWGGSSGAFAALTGMLTYPDFYKVCVARSGQHDPSIYHAWWSDQFQGMTEVVAEDGTVRWVTDTAPGNLELAPRLEGRLLLMHGELDENVHPAHSARMAHALIAVNKRFDYFVVPGAAHGWGPNWPYVQRMIWTYFVRYLMGDEG